MRWGWPLPLAKLDPPAPFSVGTVGLASETDPRRSPGGTVDGGAGEGVGFACWGRLSWKGRLGEGPDGEGRVADRPA